VAAAPGWGNISVGGYRTIEPIPRYGPGYHNREIVTVRRREHVSAAPCAAMRRQVASALAREMTP
jgi:hypothetical protein